MKKRNEMNWGATLKNPLRRLKSLVFLLTPALSLGERGQRAGIFGFANDRPANPNRNSSGFELLNRRYEQFGVPALAGSVNIAAPPGDRLKPGLQTEVHGEGKGRVHISRRASILIGLICLFVFSRPAFALPSAWQHAQPFEITTPGLMKISLPAETLDAARPALEDLRLHDADGNEVPFLITRPVPAGKAVRSAKTFLVSLQPNSTVITLETGLAQPLDGVTLETPAQTFIKAVLVEYSDDGKSWRTLVSGQPVFRQANGVEKLKISFPPTAAHWLRLTVEDQRSQPVPFTGARIGAAAAEVTPGERQDVTIAERNENPGETRLTLSLGAANLDVASVQLETDEPLFTRAVTFTVPRVTELGVFEQAIGQGVIYRVALEGQPVSANLSVPLEQQIRSRELVLTINNGDSPPLPIRAVRIERRPVYLTFMARRAGTFHLLTGNKFCAAPRYDLAALGADLKNAVVAPVEISALADNAEYHAPDTLSGVDMNGPVLDISAWKYRLPLVITGSGAQQMDLGPDVLAHAARDFADLRVLRGSNQIPFIIQRTSINRTLKLQAFPIHDPQKTKLSRWLIWLPQANLPITRLTCVAETPLFQRTLTLSTKMTDERGGEFSRQIGSATWKQTPESKQKTFSLTLDAVPQDDLLMLDTDNGDNLPIQLKEFTAVYPVTRVLFKANAGDPIYLYYGNSQVAPPTYDISLVAGELLAAEKNNPQVFSEEQLKKSSWAESQTPGQGGIVFWGILAVVVVGLLAIISRLLPKTPAA